MGKCRACAAALTLMLSAGCASYGSHLSASPLAAREDELTLAADALIIDRGLGPQVVPNPELGFRYGLSDHVDLGGRVNVGSLQANARLRVLHTKRLDLALVPGIGFGFVPVTNADSGLFDASLVGAALWGVKLARRSQLVFGPRALATYAFPLTAFQGDAEGAKVIYHIGGTLGVRLPVGKNTYLFPDVNLLFPYDSKRHDWYFPTIQTGLALAVE